MAITQKDTIIACDLVRHSGTDIHCTEAWFPGPRGQVQSCGIQQAWAWWEGGKQPAGSSAGVSQSPCQELTGPIREELRPHPGMLISPSEEPGSRASAGVHCHGYSSSHTILPEQVNRVERMWRLGIGCTRLRDLHLHHRFSEQSHAAEWESKSIDFFCFIRMLGS